MAKNANIAIVFFIFKFYRNQLFKIVRCAAPFMPIDLLSTNRNGALHLKKCVLTLPATIVMAM